MGTSAWSNVNVRMVLTAITSMAHVPVQLECWEMTAVSLVQYILPS